MDDGADYVDRVIRHRCGDEIADRVVSVEVFVRMIEVLDALAERLAALNAVVDGLPRTDDTRHPKGRPRAA
jgi:hypothetical protein